jgi:mannose-6-phosphate isomerase-like protein (cupin superfamily)
VQTSVIWYYGNDYIIEAVSPWNHAQHFVFERKNIGGSHAMYYSLSRLSRLDVKWADLFDVNTNMTFFEEHHNPYYELILVAEGAVNLQVGDTRMTLKTGDLLLLRPWEPHTGWNPHERQGQFFWVQFSCDPGLNELILDRASGLNIVYAERTELRIAEDRHEDLLVIPRRFQTRHCYKLLSVFEELVETMKQPKGYFRFKSTLLLFKENKVLDWKNKVVD